MERTMKAVIFLGNNKMELREVPVPRPGPGQVLVKLETGAVCGSDVHFYHTAPEVFTYPDTISGHEPAGIVHELGAGVGNVKVGDRVCLYHFHGCGECELCHGGHYNNCVERKGLGWEMDGSNAEYIVMNAENCFLLPPELSMEDGSIIACIGGTAYAALRKLQVSGRDLLVIYGLGAVGLSALVLAKAMGATVVGVERSPYRLGLAAKLGCDHIIDSGNEDAHARILEITGGHGSDKALETSGVNPLRKLAAKAAAIHSSIAMVGFDADTKNTKIESLSHFDTRDIIRKELKIMGSYVMELGLYEELRRFLVRKQVRLDSIVTHRFPLDRFQDALDLFATGNCGKIIITMKP